MSNMDVFVQAQANARASKNRSVLGKGHFDSVLSVVVIV